MIVDTPRFYPPQQSTDALSSNESETVTHIDKTAESMLLNENTRETIANIDSRISQFQRLQNDKTIAATVYATAISAALRRSYLDDTRNILPLPNIKSNLLNPANIQWLRLEEIGVKDDFSVAQAAEAIESVISALHQSGKMRLLFLVSSDSRIKGGEVSLHIGVQPLCDDSPLDDNMSDIIANFSKANWPGLSFKKVDAGSVTFRMNAADDPSVRVITGIPSARNQENLSATVDKLADALRGRSWRYFVVAEPVPTCDVENTIQISRDLAGRAESMKSFQISEGLSKSLAKNFSHAEGETETTSKRNMSKEQKVALAALIGTGVLSIACPALLPSFLTTTITTSTATYITAKSGLLMLLSLCSGAILAGSENKSNGKSISDSIGESIALSQNYNFSETIVNKHAEGVVRLLESQISRFQLCEGIGAWDVGTYFVGQDEHTAEIGANILRSLLCGDDSHQEPVRIFSPDGPSDNCNPLIALERFDNPSIKPMFRGEVVTHPFGCRFENLRTIVNTRELARLVNIPLSNIPGLPVRRIPADTGLADEDKDVATSGGEHKINIGCQVFRGRILPSNGFGVSPTLLSKHALVCGINGSGKTNTILGILDSLLKDIGSPFLVIEPAKQEYVEWAISRNKGLIDELGKDKAKSHPMWINVYIPGRRKWGDEFELEELRLNPFDFVWLNPKQDPKTLEHIDRLKTVINAAMPMQEVLPILMEELIYMCYGVKGCPVDGKYPCWLPKSPNERYPKFDEKLLLPSFTRMASKIATLFTSRTYAKDVQLNLRAALATRIESFKRGWRKELLNKDSPRNYRKDWEVLFEHPTVINLTSLASDDDKAFFMALLLLFIYEYRQECSELHDAPQPSPKAGKLRHLLVVEEAHRVLGKSEPTSAFSANPKQKVSEMFSNMISEVRAYGQGILIADQIPCRLNEDAVKNTNLKIVHKLVSADDRAAMAMALNLWEDQERIIGDLGVGEALVRGDMDKQTVMVKVNKNV